MMKTRVLALVVAVFVTVIAAAPFATAQSQSYIGYAYPAGGQQGKTFRVKLGGQRLTGVNAVHISGEGVTGKLVKYERLISNQETRILRDQLKELKREIRPKGGKNKKKVASKNDSMMMKKSTMKIQADPMMTMGGMQGTKSAAATNVSGAHPKSKTLALIARIEHRLAGYVNRPACAALREITYVEITVASNANPGLREIRLVTPKGLTNPLVFDIGQVPETTRKPMLTSQFQVLGKEALAQRKRPPEEEEVAITLPCTANGQIASGEINRYRFLAKKGQHLVVSVKARELIPYIADAVPGWFQPVVTMHDAKGNEVAYNDDYRFKPDPALLFVAPKDGEYVCSIHDSIYRGREDFVYRLTIGELPFVTGIHPTGCRAGTKPKIKMTGWNLAGANLTPPPAGAKPGVYQLTARKGRFTSNPVPFAIGDLPETFDKEPNNATAIAKAQPVSFPITINGRIDRKDDKDVFRFTGKKGQQIVAEVHARRLDSPTDSVIKITRPDGEVIALNDDHEDLASGTNTHHADSYVMCTLPADGEYLAHIADTARDGGPDFNYRFTLRAPRPDFQLRTSPSTVAIRGGSAGTIEVHAIRSDGFKGPIRLDLIDPPEHISCWNIVIQPHMDKVRFYAKTTLNKTTAPFPLRVSGTAQINGGEITREAGPSDDRMQAFLWQHLVPADEFPAMVYYMQPKKKPAPKKRPAAKPNKNKPAAKKGKNKPKATPKKPVAKKSTPKKPAAKKAPSAVPKKPKPATKIPPSPIPSRTQP